MDEIAKTPAALGSDQETPAPVDDLVGLLSQKVVGYSNFLVKRY